MVTLAELSVKLRAVWLILRFFCFFFCFGLFPLGRGCFLGFFDLFSLSSHLAARLVRFAGSPLAGRSCLRLQGCVYPVHGRSRSDPLARDRRTVPATSWLP